MAVRLVVADAEVLRLARQIELCAGSLELCATELATIVGSLYESGAIASEATRSALGRRADEIAKIARATSKAVAGTVASASEYVGSLGELDDLP